MCFYNQLILNIVCCNIFRFENMESNVVKKLMCFICKKIFRNFSNLRIHFEFHKKFLGKKCSNFKIVCCQEYCMRSFLLFSSFKRHIIKDHNWDSTSGESKRYSETVQTKIVISKMAKFL